MRTIPRLRPQARCCDRMVSWAHRSATWVCIPNSDYPQFKLSWEFAELRLNGQTIIYYPGSAYLGSNQPLFCGAERLMITSLYQDTAATSNADIRAKASGVVSYIYKLILAQENPLLNEGEKMYNVPRYVQPSLSDVS